MSTQIYKRSCVLSFATGPSSMELLLKDCNIQELKVKQKFPQPYIVLQNMFDQKKSLRYENLNLHNQNFECFPVHTRLIRGKQIPGDKILYRVFNVYGTCFMSPFRRQNF